MSSYQFIVKRVTERVACWHGVSEAIMDETKSRGEFACQPFEGAAVLCGDYPDDKASIILHRSQAALKTCVTH